MTADAELWEFALKVYGTEGVAAACLELQDRFGADVPVVLAVLWAARRGVAVDADAMAALEAAAGPWRAEMVVPLRALRRRLKAGPDPAPSAETEALRGEIKRAELHAEKIELRVLAGWIAGAGAGQAEVRANLGAALAHYAGGQDVPEELTAPLVAAAEAA
ncbi:hypothetical protein OG2516_16374 [Oceanicola granulosus HTCC2516]|uniref:TIGR02444 family protein n=1 Tax=Oceanicola granulosus (strain ATCC BAA-861 / DSM 15982 / KCTC 12143 / HTCC2516) TaxID=314256 RepID=Q2CGP1_OCEGH|nr:TIGR02444 family protein [Oceanicola granulosus]EAR51894.1 hypothetical protein OG2516_16374 [Oceanicola granulosus HTCC2516]